jgi:restriction system protein
VPFIPTKEQNTDITSTEFEKYIISVLKKQFQQEGISNYSFTHNVHKVVYDGSYQIDGEIKFSCMGADYVTLVECKKFKGPIKRELIQTFHGKIISTGAHKGIFVTTSYFQSGALLYAKEHGIALISIVDGVLRYEARSTDWEQNPVLPSRVDQESFSMAMQTATSEKSIAVLFIDDTDALYRLIIDE